MDNSDKPSNSSWLSLLRKKINNKFKRNRQKIEDDVLENENPIEENQPEVIASSNLNPLSAQNCEEMKQELLKLNWYWPNLSRLDAQKLLSQKPNGSFL